MEKNKEFLARKVLKAIESFDRSTKNIVIWKQFLKFQLIKEILYTGKQK